MSRLKNRIILDDAEERTSIEQPLMLNQHNPTDQLDGFLNEVSRISQSIDAITQNANRIVQLQNSAVISFGGQTNHELDALSQSTQMLLQQTRGAIKTLNEQTKRMGSPPERRRHESGLAKKLNSAAKQFKEAEEEVSRAHRERLVRQYKIVNPDASEYEIDRSIREGGAIFSKQLLSPKNEQKQALQEVQARNIEIQKIEKQVVELFQLMQEMSTMIDEQQVTIDIAAEYVEKTDVMLEKGTEELTRGIDHAVSTRKSKWRIFAIVGSVIVVLLIILLIWLGANGFFKGGQQQSAASTPKI